MGLFRSGRRTSEDVPEPLPVRRLTDWDAGASWRTEETMAESWKTTKVMEMTGEQLAVAVRQGVLRAWGVLLLLSVLVGIVVALVEGSLRS